MSARVAGRSVALIGLVGCVLTGCGSSNGYDLSGKVTFNGAPIPAGKIYFSPDGSKGNTGATGYATITNGEYDTASPDGKSTVGGAMTVRIEGWDPAVTSAADPGDPLGEKSFQALFPTYETTAELEQATATKDFEVPAEAANRKDAPENNRNVGP